MLLLFPQKIESEDDRVFLFSIYEEYYPLMCHTACGIVRNKQDAEDITHDVFMYMAEHIKRFRKIECCTLPFYLVMCIKRRCFNHLKKRETQKKHVVGSIDHEAYSFEYPDAANSVEEQVLLRLKFEQVQKAFSRLPEKLKDVLRFKYLLEMSDGEIAETLGIQRSSVRGYLTRARRAVYQICKEEGYV